jgi:hypothetical protein
MRGCNAGHAAPREGQTGVPLKSLKDLAPESARAAITMTTGLQPQEGYLKRCRAAAANTA